ncbi:MAG TPA: metalloregulator ArsR/SmtB family transcription factor [Steroidobacteraceae bacterium]
MQFLNSMASSDSTTVLGWLKAAGEDSRLRLLALCARQELSVSDLAEALRQSEPRVSRHLKILCDAGLLERMRQGQWVHYRVTQEAAAAAFVQGLLGQVERKDPLFTQYRAAARPAGDTAATGKTLESRLGRALAGFVEAVDVGAAAAGGSGVGGPEEALEGSGAALVVGVEHLELLKAAADVAGRCVAIAHSRRAAQSARAFAERHGFACRVLLAASSNALCEKDVDAAGAPFDVVFLDHVALPESALDGMLTYGRRALAANGRLWVFERYEALAPRSVTLEGSREKVLEHPIGRLRRLLGDVGLSCERLSPIEADGEHVIAAVAVPSRGVSRGTGAAGAA